MRMLWMTLSALIALLLTGCGLSPQEDFAQRVGQAMKSPTSDASVATPLANMRRVALAAPDTVDAPSITPDQLFDWAEATYPQFFPTKEKTLTWSVYQFRYYKDTDVYLAVESGQEVVALGKPTEGKVMPLGSLSSFEQVVSPDFWKVTRIVSVSDLLLAQGDFSHLDGQYRIRAAGDLNGDGFDDLVLGPIGFSEFKFLNSDKYYAFPFHKLLIAFFNPRLGSYELDPTLQSTLPAMQWAHKAWISDFNKDGYNDVFVIGTGPRSSTLVGEKGVFWAAFWHRGLKKSIA